MPIIGLRDSSNFVTNQRPENWREKLLLLYPHSAGAQKAPLTALTSLMGSESTTDPVFHWWEKEFDDRRLKLSAAITVGTTSWTVDSAYKTAKIAKAGDLLLVEETGEIVRVATDPTADGTIVVARGAANTTPTLLDPAGIGKNPYLQIMGSAFEEGSNAPSGVNYDPTEYSNYTQIFRHTLEMTRTAEQTRLRTGDAVKEAKRECFEYFSVDMERAFLFGKKYATTLNGKPLRYTNGLIAQIAAANQVSVAGANGALDMDEFESHMEAAFKFGSNEKLCFGSNASLMVLQGVVRKNTTYNIESGVKEYGMNVTRFVTPVGTLVFKVHPLFNQMVGGSTGGTAFTSWANNLLIIDQANLKYRYLQDVKYEPKLAENDLDGMKSGYIAECGLEVHHAKTHYLLKGLRSAAKDS